MAQLIYKCQLCRKTFGRKSTLQQHITGIHSEDKRKFKCSLCQKTFGRKSTLKQHITGIHSEDKRKFECPFCQKAFGRKSTLKQHITGIHSEDKRKFECSLCQKTFGRKSTLEQHITATHSVDKQKLECSICGKKFSRNFCLKRHVKSHNHKTNFECATCGAIFNLKENLSRHIRTKHENNKPESFECAYCRSKFGQEKLLMKHICLRHSRKNQVIDGPELKCLKCGIVFQRRNELNKHYEAQHNIALQFEEHQFVSSQKFEEWLHDEEHKTITQFKKANRYDTLTKSIRRLKCCRSRGYWNLPNTDDRKRCLKVSGYKGLGGFCPAEIIVTTFSDGTCNAKYQKTHVGHTVGDIKELKHVYMRKSEKLDIAAKIQSDIPRTHIFKQQMLSSTQTKEVDRLSLLNNYDLHNIAVKYNLDFENHNRPFDGSDPISTEALITQYRDTILFYKRQGDEDSKFNILSTEDFVLVIMNEEQEANLRRYGHDVIAIDETHDTNPYNFILHTLSVLNVDGKYLPVAFLISNRSDQIVVDFFILCIRDKIGSIIAQTLITDMQSTYYNSWEKLMTQPEYFLFYTRHVKKAWLKNYKKVTNIDKRRDVKKLVLDLAQEPNLVRFEEKLTLFMSIDDDDIVPFVEYFSENYYYTAHQWAYCFRQSAGIDTNMHLERFHGIFKRVVARGQQINTIQQCLLYIFKYLTRKHAEVFQKEIKKKIPYKLKVLRNRHRTAFKYFEEGKQINVISVDETIFIVDSFQKSDDDSGVNQDNYLIRKTERKYYCSDSDRSCQLFCDSCGFCYHEFFCVCHDYAIRDNMCKHIHWLGLHLKKNRSCVPENPENVENILILPEESVDVNNIICENIIENISKSVDEESVESIMEEMVTFIRQISVGETRETLEEVKRKFLEPIKPFLLARRNFSFKFKK